MARNAGACAQKKWGPALLPAPTAPRHGFAGVRNLGQSGPKAPPTRPRSWRTSSGVASYRSGPKTRFLVRFGFPRKASPPNSPPHWPEGFSDFDIPRPFLDRPPFARPVPLGGKPPSREVRPALPAPLADWSGGSFAASSPFRAVLPQSSFHRLPAEIGPSVARRAFLPLPALR